MWVYDALSRPGSPRRGVVAPGEAERDHATVAAVEVPAGGFGDWDLVPGVRPRRPRGRGSPRRPPRGLASSRRGTVLRSSEVGLALSRAGFGDVHVLSHEAADRAFTENRRELVRTIDAGGVSSIRDLARRVGRDTGNVKRDLDVLVAENLVAFESDGHSKRPNVKPDTIVQEPIVTGSTKAASGDRD